MELEKHENPTKTSTPLKRDHPLSWWLKWIASIILIIAMIFTSNNMYDIEGHINCVSSIEEFKWQLPDNAKVIKEDRIVDDRGTRFILIGKYEKNNL